MDEREDSASEVLSAELVFARLDELRALLQLAQYLRGFRAVRAEGPPDGPPDPGRSRSRSG